MFSQDATKGFTAIELLVAVFLLSVAVLGFSALQTKSLRFAREAHYNSIAATALADMAARMAGNPAGMTAGAYHYPSSLPGSDPACIAACSHSDQAQRDAYLWGAQLSQDLTDAQGTITLTGDVYQLTLTWDHRTTDAASPACGDNPDTDLACRSIEVLR